MTDREEAAARMALEAASIELCQMPIVKADIEGICRAPELCWEYNEWVRCGPCGMRLIRQKLAHIPERFRTDRKDD